MVLNLKQSSKDLSRINEDNKTKIVIDNSQPYLVYIFLFFNQGFVAQTTS